MKNINVRFKPADDAKISQEDFERTRDRVYADFATCRRIQGGIGKYVENTFGGSYFGPFSEVVDKSIRSGRLMRTFDDMLQQLGDARSTGHNYNQRNYYYNTARMEEHGRGMSEYATRLFFQKCPKYTASFGDRQDQLPPLVQSEACDDLTVELMNSFRRHSEQQITAVANMKNLSENADVMNVDDLIYKVGLVVIALIACNIGIIKMNFDLFLSITQR